MSRITWFVTALVVFAFLYIPLPVSSAEQVTFSGTILDQHGDPVSGADIYIYQWGQEPVGACYEDQNGSHCEEYERHYHQAQARTDAAGKFSVVARDGQLSLSANREGYGGFWQEYSIKGDTSVSIEMLKFPEKTAEISGKVTSGGRALPFVSISVENPVYGIHECSSSEADQTEPRPVPADEVRGGDRSSGGAGSSEPAPTSIVAPDYYRGCSITIKQDGTYSGKVTPGYSIVRAHYQSWRDSDGVEYYAQSRIVDLNSGKTTLDFELVPRPGPDSIIQGYVLNQTGGKAVPKVYVSFSNQDTYGWAQANTDADGSYRVAIRSGYTQVHVYAEGYLPWEGQVLVKSGESKRFDISLTPGKSLYGGCCFYAQPAVAESSDGAKTAGAPVPPSASPTSAPSTSTSAAPDGSDGGEDTGRTFQDLGGGLGPYDASKASDGDTEGADAPGLGLLVLIGAIAVALLVGRHK